MLWKGRRQSDNIQDSRGRGGGFGRGMPGGRSPIRIPMGGRAGGGMSISTIIILVVLYFGLRACGVDPLQILAGGDGGPAGVPGGGGQVTQGQAPASDEMTQFVSVVLAETEDVWNGIFQAEGLSYQEPRLVLFTNQVQSACGFASAAFGPFYFPGDQKVLIDLVFFRALAILCDA